MSKPGRDNRLRIIGGRWRGRRLFFPSLEELRPTPDRVRETVFNWLTPRLEGARCLDLFAGTGALGIEALSRGAAEVVFVEHHPMAVRYLRDNLRRLGIEPLKLEQADVLTWLRRGADRAHPFDMAFLDPPFGAGLLGPACIALEQGGWLTAGARIYLETERCLDFADLPAGWEITRDKTAGRVTYRLAVRQSRAESE